MSALDGLAVITYLIAVFVAAGPSSTTEVRAYADGAPPDSPAALASSLRRLPLRSGRQYETGSADTGRRAGTIRCRRALPSHHHALPSRHGHGRLSAVRAHERRAAHRLEPWRQARGRKTDQDRARQGSVRESASGRTRSPSLVSRSGRLCGRRPRPPVPSCSMLPRMQRTRTRPLAATTSTQPRRRHDRSSCSGIEEATAWRMHDICS